MVGHLVMLLRQHLGTWWVHGVYLGNTFCQSKVNTMHPAQNCPEWCFFIIIIIITLFQPYRSSTVARQDYGRFYNLFILLFFRSDQHPGLLWYQGRRPGRRWRGHCFLYSVTTLEVQLGGNQMVLCLICRLVVRWKSDCWSAQDRTGWQCSWSSVEGCILLQSSDFLIGGSVVRCDGYDSRLS